MARQIRVEITGDASGLERAFQQAGQDAQRFGRQVEGSNRSVASSFDPLLSKVRQMRGEADELTRTLDRQAEADQRAAEARMAQVRAVAAFGAGLFGLGRTLGGAGAAVAAFNGEESEFSRSLGDAGDAFTSLASLDFEGFFRATQASAERTKEALGNYAQEFDNVNDAERALNLANAASAMGFDKQAEAIRDAVEAAKLQKATIEALDFGQRQYNQTIIDGTAYLVAFKGAHDATMIGPAGGAPSVYGATPTTPRRPTQGLFLTPSERREVELQGVQGMARIPLLSDRIQWLEQQRKGTSLHSEYARISREIASTEAEIAAIKTAQNAKDKAARDAAAAEAKRLAAEAAARERARREAAAAAEQRRQFRLIGLSPEGERPTPTVANLRRQASQIQARVDAGEGLPAELLRRLPTVSKALAGGIKNMKEETRAAIAEFFRAIRDEWKKGDENLKPFATAGLNSNAIVKGLGLTAAQARRLRARLAGSTAGGQMLAPSGGSTAYGMNVPAVNLYLDGQVVGRSTKRYLSNDSVHSPIQKRGPNAGRS